MSQELITRAVELFRERKHTRIVAEILGLRLDRTRRLLRAGGIHTNKGRVGVCHRRHEDVRRMAAEGWSIDAMATELGTNQRAVSNYIRKHSFSRPEHRQHPQGGSPFARNHRGPNNPTWKGGRTTTRQGYVLVWLPEHPQANRHGYVWRHRLVMEKRLGRYLTRQEVVHHVNGVPGDDRDENLQLFACNADHLRHELTGVPCPARGRKGPRGPRRKTTPSP